MLRAAALRLKQGRWSVERPAVVSPVRDLHRTDAHTLARARPAGIDGASCGSPVFHGVTPSAERPCVVDADMLRARTPSVTPRSVALQGAGSRSPHRLWRFRARPGAMPACRPRRNVHRRAADEAGDKTRGRVFVDLHRLADLEDVRPRITADAIGHGHRLDLVMGHVNRRRGDPVVQQAKLLALRSRNSASSVPSGSSMRKARARRTIARPAQRAGGRRPAG